MWSTALVVVLTLNLLAPSTAFFGPVRHFSRVSTVSRAASSTDNDYISLIANVKKNTPPGSVIVIKYGGHAMENEELKRFFCEDIAALCSVRALYDYCFQTYALLLD
jgi:hypothetical protein